MGYQDFVVVCVHVTVVFEGLGWIIRRRRGEGGECMDAASFNSPINIL